MAESTALNEALLAQLQKETFVLLHTVDAETGAPTSNAISWVYANDATTLRFAIDQRSRLLTNIKQNPRITISVFESGKLFAIYGHATLLVETLDEVSIRLACIQVEIETVREAMFYGGKLSVMPEYEKTYDQRAASKLDGQVYAALKKA